MNNESLGKIGNERASRPETETQVETQMTLLRDRQEDLEQTALELISRIELVLVMQPETNEKGCEPTVPIENICGLARNLRSISNGFENTASALRSALIRLEL